MFDVEAAVRDIESKAFYGKISKQIRNAFQSPHNYRVEAQELAEPMLKRIEDEILKACGDHDSSKVPVYIHVVHVRDPITANVVRNKIYVRFSRPAPLTNSYLFRYHRDEGLQFEWCLPEESIIEMMLTHPERDKKFNHELIRFMQLYRANKLDCVAGIRA